MKVRLFSSLEWSVFPVFQALGPMGTPGTFPYNERMETRCRHFNGYKPCGRSETCNAQCAALEALSSSVVIIHLGALGAVLRSTALLPAIHRKYPGAQVTWITEAPAHQLLIHNSLIDLVVRADANELLRLQGRQFDVALVIDKSDKAAGILNALRAQKIFGFIQDSQFGKILPATPAAERLWQLGLSNHEKFFVNQKTENHLVHEALELGTYRREPYLLPLTPAEQESAVDRSRAWRFHSDQPIVGLNTGCGPLMPAKKWTVETHRKVIQALLRAGFENLVLLGGPEDKERNQQMGHDLPVLQSPCDLGIRDGLVSIQACDIVITGDSFGMHAAIALRRDVIAWFGPSCAHEIDLYDRGEKIAADVDCSPCWKRSCQNSIMCHEQVPAKKVLAAVIRAQARWRQAQHRSEMQLDI